MDDKTDSVIATLERAVSQIDAQERAAIKAHTATLKDMAKRRKMVQSALNGLAGSNGHATHGVSPERLEKVIEYLRKHPQARQVDIATRTSLNTGSVSVALRRLSEAGRVAKADHKDRGSQVWVLKEKKKEERELVLHAGEGAHQGRLKAAA